MLYMEKTMKKKFNVLITAFLLFALYGVANANPCAMKHANPCSMNHANPCAMKHANPCNKKAQVDPKLVTRPHGTQLFSAASRAILVKEGKQLFEDKNLGTNGMTCSTCHTGNAGFSASFAKPYPHKVAMAVNKANISSVSADEFVQFCTIVPLQGKPLAWEGRKLAALTAYVVDVKQVKYRANQMSNPCAIKHANPCAMKHANPCAMKHANPCAMKHANPCAMKHANPCAMKHANPCAMKHANPCAMKQSSLNYP